MTDPAPTTTRAPILAPAFTTAFDSIVAVGSTSAPASTTAPGRTPGSRFTGKKTCEAYAKKAYGFEVRTSVCEGASSPQTPATSFSRITTTDAFVVFIAAAYLGSVRNAMSPGPAASGGMKRPTVGSAAAPPVFMSRRERERASTREMSSESVMGAIGFMMCAGFLGYFFGAGAMSRSSSSITRAVRSTLSLA